MKRGELYRVYKAAPHDPKNYRIFVIVSRQVLIDSKYSTMICAPVYSSYDKLSSQVPIGVEEGLKHESSIHCDELISIPKSALSHYIGLLPIQKIKQLDDALKVALQLT